MEFEEIIFLIVALFVPFFLLPTKTDKEEIHGSKVVQEWRGTRKFR